MIRRIRLDANTPLENRIVRLEARLPRKFQMDNMHAGSSRSPLGFLTR